MENQHKDQSSQNGAAPSSEGSRAPVAKPQGKYPEVKEGNSAQQRPEYGSNAGPNTANRED